MNVSGRGKGDKQDLPGKNAEREASPASHPVPTGEDEALQENPKFWELIETARASSK